MRFRMEFDCDNAAFEGEERADETSRILRTIMGKVGAGQTEGPCIDTNGNKVGSWAFTSDEDDG